MVDIQFFHTIVTQGPSIEDGQTNCPPWTNCLSHGQKNAMDIGMTGQNNIDLTVTGRSGHGHYFYAPLPPQAHCNPLKTEV